jgi:hypothetical protein
MGQNHVSTYEVGHELTDADLVLVVGGDGDPDDVEPVRRGAK